MNTPTLARDIPVDQIEPVFKRAREKGGWEDLKADMRANGQKVPIQVKDMGRRDPKTGYRYQLICGQGRLEAATALKWERISAIVKDVSPEEFTGIFFNENINRQSLPWATKGRLLKDIMADGKKTLEEACADLHISMKLGHRYLNVINQTAQGLEGVVQGMGMNVAEQLTKLPAAGQKMVMAVVAETNQDVTAVVAKAEKLEAKGEGWTQAALLKAIRGVKETLDRQLKQLRPLRLHYALGPQNVLRLMRDPKFHAALKSARVNLSTISALEE